MKMRTMLVASCGFDNLCSSVSPSTQFALGVSDVHSGVYTVIGPVKSSLVTSRGGGDGNKTSALAWMKV